MLLASAQIGARARQVPGLRVKDVPHRARVRERAGDAKRRHERAGCGRKVGRPDRETERRAEAEKTDRAGQCHDTAVHYRVERGAEQQAVGDPQRKLQKRCPHAEQRGIEHHVAQLCAPRVRGQPGVQEHQLRVGEELQCEQHPDLVACAALGDVQSDDDEAERECDGAHQVIGAHHGGDAGCALAGTCGGFWLLHLGMVPQAHIIPACASTV
jgi:hypothetical protein